MFLKNYIGENFNELKYKNIWKNKNSFGSTYDNFFLLDEEKWQDKMLMISKISAIIIINIPESTQNRKIHFLLKEKSSINYSVRNIFNDV